MDSQDHRDGIRLLDPAEWHWWTGDAFGCITYAPAEHRPQRSPTMTNTQPLRCPTCANAGTHDGCPTCGIKGWHLEHPFVPETPQFVLAETQAIKDGRTTFRVDYSIPEDEARRQLAALLSLPEITKLEFLAMSRSRHYARARKER